MGGDANATVAGESHDLLESLEPRLLMAASARVPKLLMVRTGRSDAAEGSAAQPGSLAFAIKRKGNAALLAKKSIVFVRTVALAGPAAAVAGVDFQALSTKVVFKPGQKLKTVTVPLVGNGVAEDDRTVGVELFAAKKAAIKVATAQGTIVDDDAPPPPPPQPPQVAISDTALPEGNSASKDFAFVVSLNKPSSQTVSVRYATSNSGANTGDNDYQETSGTLTFGPGQTSKTINVKVFGDTKFEGDENFHVNLFDPVNVTIADNQGIGTITNDDPPPAAPPKISISNASAAEGNSSTKDLSFNVTLDKASTQTVTVQFTTTNGTATTADNDYQSANGTLTFNPGQTSKAITVKIVGDTKVEANETFFVNIGNAINGDIVTSSAVGAINNDDTAPAPADLTIQSSTVNVDLTDKVYRIQLDVKNNGAGPAAASQVRFELRDVQQGGSSTVTLVTLSVPTIAAGQTANLNYIVDPNPAFVFTDFPPLWGVLTINDANNGNNAKFLDFVPTGDNLNNPQ